MRSGRRSRFGVIDADAANLASEVSVEEADEGGKDLPVVRFVPRFNLDHDDATHGFPKPDPAVVSLLMPFGKPAKPAGDAIECPLWSQLLLFLDEQAVEVLIVAWDYSDGHDCPFDVQVA